MPGEVEGVPEEAVEAAVRSWSVESDTDDLETALRDVLRAAAPLIHEQDRRRFPDGTYCICPEHDLLMPYRFVHWEWTAGEGCPVLMDGENVCGEPVQVVDPVALIRSQERQRIEELERELEELKAQGAACAEAIVQVEATLTSLDPEELEKLGLTVPDEISNAGIVLTEALEALKAIEPGIVDRACQSERQRVRELLLGDAALCAFEMHGRTLSMSPPGSVELDALRARMEAALDSLEDDDG